VCPVVSTQAKVERTGTEYQSSLRTKTSPPKATRKPALDGRCLRSMAVKPCGAFAALQRKRTKACSWSVVHRPGRAPHRPWPAPDGRGGIAGRQERSQATADSACERGIAALWTNCRGQSGRGARGRAAAAASSCCRWSRRLYMAQKSQDVRPVAGYGPSRSCSEAPRSRAKLLGLQCGAE
jgi:hypothetical protein